MRALERIKKEYRCGQNTHQEEFKMLERKIKSDLDKSAINWIRNHYDFTKSSREVFDYLERRNYV